MQQPETRNQKPETRNQKLSNLLSVALCLCVMVLACAGCTSTYAEWGGESVVLDAEGRPIVDRNGTVQKVKEPVRLSSWRHWTDSLIGTAALGIEEKRIDFALSNYSAKPSAELRLLAEASLKGAAELAAKIGAAIATSGGSAGADAILGWVKNFIKAGGDVSKAKVECKDGSCTFTDGAVTCTDGNCTYNE